MMTFEQAGDSPPPYCTLLSDEVHVWRMPLEQPAGCVRQLLQSLSADERTRAAQFHFERDRRRFIVARGALRIILGSYLSLEPSHLQFGCGSHGKPYLSKPDYCAIRFNLAHSHELALYALSYGREIGVDIEYIRPMPNIEQIVGRFFSASESAALQALPPGQQLEAFFNCWTRKEAYIKAIGDGLAQPLDQFQVSLAPGELPQLLRVEKNSSEVARWRMEALKPAPGYVAALAVEGFDWSLKL
ncbi:MAG: 4'-phosphopantetheinyl transferase [Chloroflexi bacterium HGW-Chloroflexi-1]|nr:MAG: 4'-phosphopantetheinyl transferase [Chloroflexi bacterium HGW-Chloroflexi-1]